MIRGDILETIQQQEVLRDILSSIGKVENVRLVRKYDPEQADKPMRNFAFVDFTSLDESKKVYDYCKRNGLCLLGSEVVVNYCKGNRPF